jgi:hypothetical protein
LPIATIVAGMPTMTSRYGPIDGCEESTICETRYSQPTGIPIHRRTEPMAMSRMRRAPASLRVIAR